MFRSMFHGRISCHTLLQRLHNTDTANTILKCTRLSPVSSINFSFTSSPERHLPTSYNTLFPSLLCHLPTSYNTPFYGLVRHLLSSCTSFPSLVHHLHTSCSTLSPVPPSSYVLQYVVNQFTSSHVLQYAFTGSRSSIFPRPAVRRSTPAVFRGEKDLFAARGTMADETK